MSATVDNRVVSLSFDSKDFEQKISATLKALEELDKKLELSSGIDTFSKLGDSAKSVDMSGLTSEVEATGRSFSALEVMAITALANITNSAVNLGKQLVSNIINPITQGGLQRAMNIEQANFQFEGMGIQKSDKTAKSYDEVMNAVLGTAYSYDVAAKAASQLAASNVGVTESVDKQGKKYKTLNSDMTKSLLGIAGVASMTGSSFDDISQVFTRVAGQGRVMANDLNSIAARGLNAAATLAEYLGVSESEVRDLVSKGKIDFQTFSNAMSEAFGSHAKDSTKMFHGAIEDVKAALARIGADIYGPLLESGRDALNAMTPLVDVVHERLNPAIASSTEFVEKLSKKFQTLLNIMSTFGSTDMHMFAFEYPERFAKALDAIGVSTKLTMADIEVFSNRGINLVKLLAKSSKKSEKDITESINNGKISFVKTFKVLKEYFDSVEKDEKKLKSLEKAIDELLDLHIPKSIWDTVDSIRNTFRNILGIGKNVFGILKGFGKLIFSIAKSASPLATVVLKLAEGLTGLANGALDAVSKLKIFEKLSKGVAIICKGIDSIVSASINGINKLADNMDAAFDIFDKVLDKIISIGGKLMAGFGLTAFTSMAASIATSLNAFKSPMDWLLSLIDPFRNFWKASDYAIRSMRQVGTVLGSWQKSLEANILIKLAAAIGAIALSMKLLSTIPGEKLGTVLGFMAEAITSIGIAMKMATAVMGPKSMLMLGTATTQMIKISVAMLIMAMAFKKVADLSWDGLAIGLIGIGSMVAMLIALSDTLAGAKKMQKGLTGMIIMAVAMKIMAGVISDLAELEWEELMKGLIGVGALCLAIIAFQNYFQKTEGFLKAAFGLLLIATAVKTMASAVASMSGIENIQNGLLGLGAIMIALVAFTTYVNTTGAGAFLKASAGILLIGVALDIMASAVAKMSELDSVAIGVLALMVILGALVVACNSLQSCIPGAIAMLIIATSLAVLAGVIGFFAALDPEKVITAIIELALAILLVGGMAAALGTVSTQLMMFGAALLVIAAAAAVGGLAMQAIGIGFLKIAVGMTALSKASSGLGSVAKTLGALTLLLIPFGLACLIATPGILALSAALVVFGIAAILIGTGFVLLSGGLSTLIPLTEQLPALSEGLGTLSKGVMELALAGIMLVPGAAALAATALAITAMGASLIISAAGLPIFTSQLKNLAKSIPSGMNGKLTGLSKSVSEFGNNIKSASSKIIGASTAFKKIGSDISKLITSGIKMDSSAISKELTSAMKKGVESVKSTHSQFKTAGQYVVDGLISGLNSRLPSLASAAARLGKTAISSAKKALDEHSPSKEFFKIGENGTQGMINGLVSLFGAVSQTGTSLGEKTLDAVSGTLSGLSSVLDSDFDMSPTITPIVDMKNVDASWASMRSMFGEGSTVSISSNMMNKKSTSEVIADAVQEATKNAFETLIPEIQNGDSNATYSFEIPVNVSGREIAKATATYTKEELNRMDFREDRLNGVLE